MQPSNIRIFSRNIICNCVNQCGPNGIQGELYHLYSDEPIRYRDAFEMLILMEKFYDNLNFPMASTETRSFSKRKPSSNRKEMIKMEQDEKLLKVKGSKGTFLIQVQYRQNATWQGKVVCADENKTQYFRSTLELMKLIDGALNKGSEETTAEFEESDNSREKQYATS
mgnify:CR=1 FL=1